MLQGKYRTMLAATDSDLRSRGWQPFPQGGDDCITGSDWRDKILLHKASGVPLAGWSWYKPAYVKNGWTTFLYDAPDGSPGSSSLDCHAFTYATMLVAPRRLPQGPDAWVTVDVGGKRLDPPRTSGIGPLVAPELPSCQASYLPNLIVTGGRLILWNRTFRAPLERRHLTADLEAAYMPLAERIWRLLTGR